MDEALAEQFNIEEVENPPIWTFSADGTYTYQEIGTNWEFAGTWKDGEGGISLTVETCNGKPFNDARAAVAKAAETGASSAIADEVMADYVFPAVRAKTWLVLSEDGKSLVLTDAHADTNAISLMPGGVLLRLADEG